MANVVVKLKVMPESPETNLDEIKEKATKLIEKYNGYVHKVEQEPIAFGLIALNFIFLIPEAQGSTDNLEAEISKLEHVQSVEVTDVRRAFG